MDRQYDKGERRYKHVGTGPEPRIEFDENEPRKWIGKCPSTLSETDRKRLLEEAIPGLNGDRELSAPKKLYAVHDGAIYEAQTSDRGRTYHGYPFKGKISGAILDKLEVIAQQKGCSTQFAAWVKSYIALHGPRR